MPKKFKNLNHHSVIVALPLAIITVFCFSYVLMQPAKTLNKNEATAASKRPALFTGKPLPEIKSDNINEDLDAQQLATDGTDKPLSVTRTEDSATDSMTPQAPVTTNPQQSAGTAAANSVISNSNKASGLPQIKVISPKNVTKLLNNL